ncbi:unnamed protein product [Prorocentrum cordatum]|uniref:Uncharacterized protein n=1 Tax=Prorocentrum cordatum TaxID=2364126 RepID=A0ABN9WVL2_9DINO|nr:unnamed protein product [Polarella glacialis]
MTGRMLSISSVVLRDGAWSKKLLGDAALLRDARLPPPVPFARAASITTRPLADEVHDVSTQEYADDIYQTWSLSRPNPLGAMAGVLAFNAILDREFREQGGFAHNPDKEVCVCLRWWALGPALLWGRFFPKGSIFQCARAVLRGRRPVFDPRNPGASPTCRFMSESHVLKSFGITDIRAELTMQRLRQWQRLVRYPADGRQVLTTLFGISGGFEEGGTFAPSGMIAGTANPWARQFGQDVGALLCLSNGPEFLASHSILEIRTITQAFFPVVARVAPRNARAIGALDAAVYRVILLVRGHPICRAMRQEVPLWNALGVPLPHRRLALLGAVRQQGERVGAASAETIADYLGGIKAGPAITNEQMRDKVRHCRISFTHGRNIMQIHVAADAAGSRSDSLMQVMLDIIEQVFGQDRADITNEMSRSSELEQDPGPLLRELRYRTCLEQPPPAERAELERRFWEPLRALRAAGEGWWRAPAATEALSRQLDEQGFVLIDGFLPDVQVRRLRACAEGLYQSSAMASGATTGGSSRVGLPHRGDFDWLWRLQRSGEHGQRAVLLRCGGDRGAAGGRGARRQRGRGVRPGRRAVVLRDDADVLPGREQGPLLQAHRQLLGQRPPPHRHPLPQRGLAGGPRRGAAALPSRRAEPADQARGGAHLEPPDPLLVRLAVSTRGAVRVPGRPLRGHGLVLRQAEPLDAHDPKDVLGARSLAAAAAAALPAVDDADRGHAEVAEGRRLGSGIRRLEAVFGGPKVALGGLKVAGRRVCAAAARGCAAAGGSAAAASHGREGIKVRATLGYAELRSAIGRLGIEK